MHTSITPTGSPDSESNTPQRIYPYSAQQPPPMVATYKECLKNHAAVIGGHALDGCGEFLATATANPTDPNSMICAACGCHRNFHRRRNIPSLEFHHRSVAPPETFSLPPPPTNQPTSMATPVTTAPSGKKRFRLKFTQVQKEKMYTFAEKISWKLHKTDVALVEDFCNEIGVSREVLKVWINNNKYKSKNDINVMPYTNNNGSSILSS